MTWSGVVRVTIAKLLSDGLTARQIADRLPFAVSRNAIIGLVHRDQTLRAIGFKNKPRKPRGQKKENMPKPERRPEKPAIISAPAEIPPPVVVEPPPPAEPPPSLRREGVPLVEIRDGQCRFPMWDLDGAPDFVMCGKAAPQGQSYCEGHRARTIARAA